MLLPPSCCGRGVAGLLLLLLVILSSPAGGEAEVVESEKSQTIQQNSKKNKEVLWIGNMPYVLSEEPKIVRQVLLQYEAIFPSSDNDGDSWLQASFWNQLGQAHYSSLEQLTASNKEQNGFRTQGSDDWHYSHALHAFEQAIAMYQELLHRDKSKATTDASASSFPVDVNLATIYFQLAETHALISTTEGGSIHNKNNEPYSQMMKYLEKAVDLYRPWLWLADQDLNGDDTPENHRLMTTLLGEHLPYHRPETVMRAWKESLFTGYALCVMRLGVLHLEHLQQGPSMTSSGSSNAPPPETIPISEEDGVSIDWIQLVQQYPQYVQELLQEQDLWDRDYKTTIRWLDEAILYFQTALACVSTTGITARTTEELPLNPPPQATMWETKRQLATAWQNRGTAAQLGGDSDRAVQYLEQALTMHRSVLEEGTNKPMAGDRYDKYYVMESVRASAEALYSLADSYLQQGNYAAAQQHYQQTMEWYQKYQLAPPLTQTMSDPESIQIYEETLQDYLDQYKNDGSISGSLYWRDDNSEVPMADDGYEGDLRVSLGSLYLAQGELVLAEMHLRHAVRLYEAVGEGLNKASAYFTLAQTLLQVGDYQESGEYWKRALELYHEALGDGVSPLPQDTTQEDWNSIRELLRNTVDDTATVQANGNIMESVAASVDYELLRNANTTEDDEDQSDDEREWP